MRDRYCRGCAVAILAVVAEWRVRCGYNGCRCWQSWSRAMSVNPMASVRWRSCSYEAMASDAISNICVARSSCWMQRTRQWWLCVEDRLAGKQQ
ncbi:hypothetical protein BHM03_00033813 [Ensete ventricosum]|nr:hypothetical protein BHM03_00033813 [Ensete ventricosum]